MLPEMKQLGQLDYNFALALGAQGDTSQALSMFRTSLKNYKAQNPGMPPAIAAYVNALIEFTMGAGMMAAVAPTQKYVDALGNEEKYNAFCARKDRLREHAQNRRLPRPIRQLYARAYQRQLNKVGGVAGMQKVTASMTRKKDIGKREMEDIASDSLKSLPGYERVQDAIAGVIQAAGGDPSSTITSIHQEIAMHISQSLLSA